MSIFVLIFMLLSLSAFVRFLLKKLLACLLTIIMVHKDMSSSYMSVDYIGL